jgi:hypothetical protein
MTSGESTATLPRTVRTNLRRTIKDVRESLTCERSAQFRLAR